MSERLSKADERYWFNEGVALLQDQLKHNRPLDPENDEDLQAIIDVYTLGCDFQEGRMRTSTVLISDLYERKLLPNQDPFEFYGSHCFYIWTRICQRGKLADILVGPS